MNRITGLLLACLLLFQTGFEAAAQKRFSLRTDNEPILKVIERIEKESGYWFVYSNELVDEQETVSVNVSNVTIEQLLDSLFAGTQIQWKIEKKQIVLKRRNAVQGQSADGKGDKIRTNGQIIDRRTSEPVIGAAVLVEGTNDGVVADADGSFSLEVATGSRLRISSLGYKDEIIKISSASQERLIIRLAENLDVLEESVVVGYGTVNKKNLTTAIAQVKADDVPKSANPNINQLLLGRAPGLQATQNSGQPDGKVNISIRGGGTPIYVVDGVVMPAGSISIGGEGMTMPSNVNRSGLGGLNPADIESVEILKDASASIYGVRSADGVILITTKKGKAGKPRVTYDGSYSFVRNYPYLKVLNAQEYMTLVNVFNKETYLYANKMYPYGGLAYDGGWTAPFEAKEIRNAQTTEWTDFVLKNGYIHNHNLTLSGGTEKVKYYLSGQYFGQDGTVVNSGMDKLTLHANIDAQVFKFLNIAGSINVNQNNYSNANVGADSGNAGALAASALYASLILPPNIPEKQDDGSYTIFSNIPNPSSMRSIEDKSKENGYNFNVSATANLWKDFIKAKIIYGMSHENTIRNSYIPSTVYFNLMKKSRGNVHSQGRRYQTFEGTLSYSQGFADVINIDALLGAGMYKQDWYGYYVSYEDTQDAIKEDDLSSATGNILPGSYRGYNEHRSVFGKLSADILDRYVISATVRMDGSDKFFSNQKYNWFPSVSFAWKLSNESFMKDISWINLLKIRGSWGVTGADNLGSSLYGNYGASEFRASFNGNKIQYTPYTLNSANSWWVSWQKTYMKNVGLDFYFLRNRISGSFDFFRNDVTRLLGTEPSSPLAMFETRKVNYGHFYRIGWELNLNTVNIDRAFRWESSLALSRVNSIWLERENNHYYEEYRVREKEPMNAWYYYNVIGIVNADRSNVPESQKTISDGATMPGTPIIEDKNGDGKITIDDIYMKNNVPACYIGFGNTFSWKNFSLDIYMYGQVGLYKSNVVLNTTSGSWLSDNSRNSSVLAYKIWNSISNPEGTRPGIAAGDIGALPGACGTNINMQNASFLKVRNITFGYTFDEKILKGASKWINSIYLYFDAQNPLTFTKYDGFDPEMYMGGGGEGGKSTGEYPATRSYSLGLRLSF